MTYQPLKTGHARGLTRVPLRIARRQHVCQVCGNVLGIVQLQSQLGELVMGVVQLQPADGA